MKWFINIIFSLLLISQTRGQDFDITIRVIDKTTKKPIKNANAIILGTTKGASTNALGFTKLNLTGSQIKLVFSHVSYETETIDLPVGINSFTVPLEKKVYQLPKLDLRQYPNNFKLKKSELKEQIATDTNGETWAIVEYVSEFPYDGGNIAFLEIFGNTFIYPEKELKEKQEGRLFLQFTIDRNGEYQSIRCLLADSLSGICSECKRILSVLPKWSPSRQHDENVDVSFIMPVYYGINEHWSRQLKKSKK